MESPPPKESLDPNITDGNRLLFIILGSLSKNFFAYLCNTHVYNISVLRDAVLYRPPQTPLITVSNHNSCLDDPMITSLLTPPLIYREPTLARWAWCAREICYKDPFRAKFFGKVRALPTDRGKGLHQPLMDVSIGLARRGDWIHVYPEGKVVQKYTYEVEKCRWGVGKLIAKCIDRSPLVIPYVHQGMQDVNPLHTWIPRPLKEVSVLVGEPLHFEDLVDKHEECKKSNPGWGDPFPLADEYLYHNITERIRENLQDLQDKLTDLREIEQQSFFPQSDPWS